MLLKKKGKKKASWSKKRWTAAKKTESQLFHHLWNWQTCTKNVCSQKKKKKRRSQREADGKTNYLHFRGYEQHRAKLFFVVDDDAAFSKTAMVTFFSPTSKTKMINSSTERENENVSEYWKQKWEQYTSSRVMDSHYRPIKKKKKGREKSQGGAKKKKSSAYFYRSQFLKFKTETQCFWIGSFETIAALKKKKKKQKEEKKNKKKWEEWTDRS